MQWTETCGRLEHEYGDLVGDAVVSAAMIAYAGPFTPDFRRLLVDAWQKKLVSLGIPHTPGCDVRQTLSDEVVIRGWKMNQLPQDSHRLVVGEYTAATSYCFLMLPITPSVSCSCSDPLNTPSSTLPPSPSVSQCLQLV